MMGVVVSRNEGDDAISHSHFFPCWAGLPKLLEKEVGKTQTLSVSLEGDD